MAKKNNALKILIIILVILLIIGSTVLGLYFGLKKKQTYYNCNFGKCEEDNNGVFTTLDNCNKNCKLETTDQNVGVSFQPEPEKEKTVSVPEKKEVVEVVKRPKYDCVHNTFHGTRCEENLNGGKYDNLASCQLNCGHMYNYPYYPYYGYPVRRYWRRHPIRRWNRWLGRHIRGKHRRRLWRPI